ncbi:MAG: DUF134 domain-containing protein [Acholeplasmataceae bacterium]|nr:DUF134 domain-containing protein [Acholeplasmataceae bacterium]
MPRPRKGKKVCCLPEINLYGPLKLQRENNKCILMSVEEYETIRLIDLEKLTQEECGERMQVARTTIQKIYTDAREKVAESLVNGCILKIEGGDYQLYSEIEKPMGCGSCRRSRCGRGRMENKDF